MSTFNIYDFFNSPDVAGYCKSIGHTFNAVESAVMVSQSNKQTLLEKHKAYETIIAKYPDMKLRKACNHEHIESFHKALGDFISCETQLLEKFLAPESGAIYQSTIGSDESDPFTNYDSALADALDIMELAESVGSRRYDEGKTIVVKNMTIKKKYLDTQNCICVKISRTGEIIHIYSFGVPLWNSESSLLKSCYIDIPVPFKRGDLVEVDYGNWMGEVYVLRDITKAADPKQHENLLEWGDLSDIMECR